MLLRTSIFILLLISNLYAENLKMINNEKKSSLIISKDFENNIEKRINFFIKNEFLKLRKNLNKSKYKSNGADQVANFIIKNL